MKKLLILWLVLVSNCLACYAQIPSGLLQYSFTTNSGPLLWNIDGNYFYQSLWTAVQDARGGLHMSADTGRFGFIGGGGTNVSIHTLHRASGWDEIGFLSGIWGVWRFSLNASIDPQQRAIVGTQTILHHQTKSVFGVTTDLGTTTTSEAVSIPLPDGMDGSWNLAMNLSTNVNVLRGTATITYATGQTIQCRALGRYFPTPNQSIIYLTGIDEDRGAWLRLWIHSLDMSISRLHGRVGGQLLNFSATN